MTEGVVLMPRRVSVTIRPIAELIEDARCATFDNNEDHSHCLLMAASWPIPGPYDDLDDQ